jgi:hypothetical protein
MRDAFAVSVSHTSLFMQNVEVNAEELPINAEFLATVKGIARETEDKFAFGCAP